MHKSAAVGALVLLFSAPAFAQRSNTVSIFVTDMSSSAGGAQVDGAYGASFDRMFGDHFSGELSVTSQRYRRFVTLLGPTSEPRTGVVTDRIYPIDVNVYYHFVTAGRWKPYVGAGLRYVNDTFVGWAGPPPIGPYSNGLRTVDPEVSGGVAFQFNQALALRLDARQVLGSHRSTVADPELKASAGLSVRF